MGPRLYVCPNEPRLFLRELKPRHIYAGWPLDRSGKNQGISQNGQGNFKNQESQAKVREFPNFVQNDLAVAGILSTE